MKKLFALLAIALCMLLSGCDEEVELELTVTDITAKPQLPIRSRGGLRQRLSVQEQHRDVVLRLRPPR